MASKLIAAGDESEYDKNANRERARNRRRLTNSTKEVIQRPWSDLPEGVLGVIAERLYIADQIHMRAVCKNWRLLVPCLSKLLPGLFRYCFLPRRIIYSISDDPNYQKQPHIVEEERELEDERGWIIPIGLLLYRAKACASRCGWVLFLESNVINPTTFCRVYRYHVYNPHTKAAISLPILELPQCDCGTYNQSANLTCAPTSPECVFVVFTECLNCAKRDFLVSTYSMGDRDTAWKTRNLVRNYHPSFLSNRLMTYMDGSFYYYNPAGYLSSFDVASQEWRLLPGKGPFIDIMSVLFQWSCRCYAHLVAYDGHLTLACLYVTKLEETAIGCDVFRYDWVEGDWKRMESLEGGALFLGEPSLGVSATGDETRIVANRIYFCMPPSRTSQLSYLVYGQQPDMEDKSQSQSQSQSQSSQNYNLFYNPWPWPGRRSWIWLD